MFALSMIWLVFHYGWSSLLLQIPHSLYSGENLCGKQKFTKICTKREFIDCHIIPFPAIVPHFNTGLQKKTPQAVLLEVKSKILWVRGEKRHRRGSSWSTWTPAWPGQSSQKQSVIFWCVPSLRASSEYPDGSRRKVHRVLCIHRTSLGSWAARGCCGA